MFGYSQPDMAGDVHDYGTKFLVTAGLLNILAMVDASRSPRGRRTECRTSTFRISKPRFCSRVFTSVVMGITSKKTDKDRLHYGAYCFGCFMSRCSLSAGR